MEIQKVVLDPLCYLQFNNEGSFLILYDKEEFMKKINQIYKVENLKEGYFSFKIFQVCSFLQTFDYLKFYILLITLLKQLKKMKVLLKLPIKPDLNENFLFQYVTYQQSLRIQKQANYLDIILYNKEYVTTSCKARNVEDVNSHIDFDYALKSIIPKDADDDLVSTIQPITMMRNELSFLHGGSEAKRRLPKDCSILDRKHQG